jgi:hypothetical protein
MIEMVLTTLKVASFWKKVIGVQSAGMIFFSFYEFEENPVRIVCGVVC